MKKPIVFACAGCSPVARLSWELAHELDKRGLAEMSCLAGVGAHKPAFLRQLENREIWVIDGCPIQCGQGIFGLIDTPVHKHIRMADLGFKKQLTHQDPVDMDVLIQRVLKTTAFNLQTTSKASHATT